MSEPLKSQPGYDRLLNKLDAIADLTQEERTAIRELPIRTRLVPVGADFVHDGDATQRSCLVLEGLVCRYKLLPSGRRQILSFHMPGDIPDLQTLHLQLMDHSLCAMSAATIAYIDHADLRRLNQSYPRLAEIFWRDTLIDAAIFREWMIGLGRRSAYARIAHLFCELMVKFRAVHLVKDDSVRLDLTQGELGDALGLSAVHVNRVLQELRGAELIELRKGVLKVLSWDGLVAAGEFDPGYLHIDRPLAA